MDNARLTAWVHGWVQGVGFRWWVYSQAMELGLSGSATNLSDGRVCVVAEGDYHTLRELLRRLSAPQKEVPRRPGTVDSVVERWSDVKGESGFRMR
ncbi:acylphosphatase [Corynebacterium vitaeruminis]|uniref:acylphosphatase n=1 Tax=Corynebacterium vitaeruminis TaxID=38305 RepID=UPI0023F414C6|nr:acylphosphatase [Corynebacterium vitaeruminis]